MILTVVKRALMTEVVRETRVQFEETQVLVVPIESKENLNPNHRTEGKRAQVPETVGEVKIEEVVGVRVVGFMKMIEANITVLQEREAIEGVLIDMLPTSVEDPHPLLPPNLMMIPEEDLEEMIVMLDSEHVS